MATPTLRPTYRTGKICYIEIPATDVGRSADFYRRAFGWRVRRRGDGSIAFDDTVSQVSGTWVLERPPSPEPGLMVYIMVADGAAAVVAVVEAGGEIVQPIDPREREVVARFRDPAGNVLGIYQQPGLAETEGQETGVEGQQPQGETTGTAAPEPGRVETGIAPWLSVSRAADAVSHYEAAFGAVERYRLEDDAGRVVVARLAIGGADFWVQEDAESSPQSMDRRSVRMVAAVSDQHGWRIGRVADPFGHHWEIGRPLP